MDRKRTVAAAGGISVVLVAGSSAFAFANGMFVASPVERAGSLGALQARLVPETKLRVTAPAVAGPGARIVPRRVSVAPIPPITMPETVPATTPTSAPAIVPAAVHAAAPVVAHSGPSTVPGHHSDDSERGEEHQSDD